MKNPTLIKKFLLGFTYAFRGIFAAFPGQTNIKVHSLAFVCVILFSFYFNISKIEWLVLLPICFLVPILEIVNTAIEGIVDEISLERKPALGRIKDLAAGAVLLAAILAVLIGGIIFWPYLFNS